MAELNPYAPPTEGRAPLSEAPSALKTLAIVSLASFPGALAFGGRLADAVADGQGEQAVVTTAFNVFGALVSTGCGIAALTWGRGYAPEGVRTPALIGTIVGGLGVVGIGALFWMAFTESL